MHDAALVASIWSEIKAYNVGRSPGLLRQKYARMAESPFVFLRGACHLFYPNLPATTLFTEAPLAWNCGDLHFENFGSYKGDDREIYFDINDFDEAALAPVSWDVVRLLTSLLTGADYLQLKKPQARDVAARCLHGYRQALAEGRSLQMDEGRASGLVADLMKKVAGRSRRKHLDKRTELNAQGRRSLKVDGEKVIALDGERIEEKARIETFMAQYARAREDGDFYRVLDVAERVAGTGSLGLPRYIVLVEGKGSPDGNYLLDLKTSRLSSLAPALNRLGISQPEWGDDAQRVESVQDAMQAVDHAFLRAVLVEGKPYILRALQASEDRLGLDEGLPVEQLEQLACTLGQILAWAQLRAATRWGAAPREALVAFGQGEDWTSEMLETATRMHELNHAQWLAYRAGWQKDE